MDQLHAWIEEQSRLAPATQGDLDELRDNLDRIHGQLAADIDTLINGLPVGRAVSLSAVSFHYFVLKSYQSTNLGLQFKNNMIKSSLFCRNPTKIQKTKPKV